jgi:hypothetical protein
MKLQIFFANWLAESCAADRAGVTIAETVRLIPCSQTVLMIHVLAKRKPLGFIPCPEIFQTYTTGDQSVATFL